MHSVLLLSAVEFYAYAAARPAAVRPRDCRLRSVASCGSFMAFDLADVIDPTGYANDAPSVDTLRANDWRL